MNGVPSTVPNGDPRAWIRDGYLGGRNSRTRIARFRDQGGYRTGDVGPSVGPLLRRQRGGALVIEGTAADGELTIEFRGFGRARSYVTGLIVEPLGQTSNLVLTERARIGIISARDRLALESIILAAAAQAVEGIQPAEGNAFQDDRSATSN